MRVLWFMDRFSWWFGKSLQSAIQHFYDLGARYVQLDDTTGLFDSTVWEWKNNPETAELVKIAEDDVYTINKAWKIFRRFDFGYCICRGNFKSTYLFEGGYDSVAKYLGKLNYDIFFLEYDDARSGGFAPLPTIWNNRDHVEFSCLVWLLPRDQLWKM